MLLTDQKISIEFASRDHITLKSMNLLNSDKKAILQALLALELLEIIALETGRRLLMTPVSKRRKSSRIYELAAFNGRNVIIVTCGELQEAKA